MFSSLEMTSSSRMVPSLRSRRYSHSAGSKSTLKRVTLVEFLSGKVVGGTTLMESLFAAIT
jgi:hypothetical protein